MQHIKLFCLIFCLSDPLARLHAIWENGPAVGWKFYLFYRCPIPLTFETPLLSYRKRVNISKVNVLQHKWCFLWTRSSWKYSFPFVVVVVIIWKWFWQSKWSYGWKNSIRYVSPSPHMCHCRHPLSHLSTTLSFHVVHNSATVCTRTVYTGMFLEVAENPQADWGSLLSQYTRSFKQLESLVEDIDPLFHLNEVMPIKVTEQPTMIPYLLSTHVEKRVTEYPPAEVLSELETGALTAALAEYNYKLGELLENLPSKKRKFEWSWCTYFIIGLLMNV